MWPFNISKYPWTEIQITLTPILKGIWWLGIGAWVGGLSERIITSYTSNQSFNATEIGLIIIALIMALCWLFFGLLFHSINQSNR
jgi:hypothetical protein